MQLAAAVSALFAPITLGNLSLLICTWYASLACISNFLIFSLASERNELWYGCAGVSILSAFFYVFFLFVEIDAHMKKQESRVQAERDYRNYDGLLPGIAKEIRAANAGLLPKEWLQEIAREHKRKYARRLKTSQGITNQRINPPLCFVFNSSILPRPREAQPKQIHAQKASSRHSPTVLCSFRS